MGQSDEYEYAAARILIFSACCGMVPECTKFRSLRVQVLVDYIKLVDGIVQFYRFRLCVRTAMGAVSLFIAILTQASLLSMKAFSRRAIPNARDGASYRRALEEMESFSSRSLESSST
jgi:hypothetical protein